MALNDVRFNVVQGGLGVVAPNEDNVSAMMFALAAPAGWPANKFKSFTDIEQVKASGVVKGHATYGEVYYQASEFFRLAPGATLWLGFSATLPTYTELHVATGGKVRQLGVYFSTFTDLASVHQAGVNTLTALHAPLVVIAAYRSATPLVINSATDLVTLTSSPAVSVLIAGDGGAEGAALATSLTLTYLPALGAVLGATAKASVHESIAWVDKFNLSNGAELDVIRLADGSNSPADSILDALNTKRYLVLRKHIGIGGTYLNDSHTASPLAGNDYAYLELSRVVQKARRLVRSALLPSLNSPVTIDADTGKLAPGSIKYFESLCNRAMNQMQAASEVSGFGVYINPDQSLLATSTLTIELRIVPRGVARNIVVNIGLTVKL